ncbi:MAG TPA: hypothetical protein VGF03_22370 [Bryobacteraceae bacterium]|jgi:hypothetical protein
MLRISFLVIAAAALWAQNAAQKGPEPPPDVDKALRARITEFCELHKQGKFRQAEQLVADDTKDYFYNSGKPRYVSYEIQSITYNQDFTKATAMVICEHYLAAPGFQGKTLKLLTPFNWKIENGQWMWYVDKDSLLITPFGKMTLAPQAGGTSTSPVAGAPTPPAIPTSVDQFFSLIQADKTTLGLKPGASDQVVISNGTPGLISLEIAQQVPGVEAKLDNTSVTAGGKAVLTVHAGPQAASGVIGLRVKPIGPQIAIKVSVE